MRLVIQYTWEIDSGTIRREEREACQKTRGILHRMWHLFGFMKVCLWEGKVNKG